MSNLLPRLRMNLDFMPSPVPDRPGLMIRDPYHYSDATLIVPPPLVQLLQFFDGESTELDLRQALVDLTGQLTVSDIERNLIDSLSRAGFLENETYLELRDARHRAFAAAPCREPAHAGSAYPAEPEQLRAVCDHHLAPSPSLTPPANLCGIAAPHASPDGGWDSYRDAYRCLPAHFRDRVFIVLGTSHYGEPDRFGLTRKNFLTPFGQARTETAWVDHLAAQAPGATLLEDYCHSVEHSIEFQIVFLQYLFGPDIRVLPILCGPYARSLYEGGLPEDNDHVRRFLATLAELHARHHHQLAWVLGVDMAHVGRRYGDPFSATAYQGELENVARADQLRIDAIAAGNARLFWEQVQDNHDPLKWCGSSPIYTFLRAVPSARAQLLRYQQWQIDPQSVVSFAGMVFTA